MDSTQPQPASNRTAARFAMVLIAVLSMLATIGTGLAVMLALVFFFHDSSSTARDDANMLALQATLIAVPVFSLGTAIVAIMAAITARRWAIWTATGMFAAMIGAAVLLYTWLGALN